MKMKIKKKYQVLLILLLIIVYPFYWVVSGDLVRGFLDNYTVNEVLYYLFSGLVGITIMTLIVRFFLQVTRG